MNMFNTVQATPGISRYNVMNSNNEALTNPLNLFYMDLYSLLENGKYITGMQYKATSNGVEIIGALSDIDEPSIIEDFRIWLKNNKPNELIFSNIGWQLAKENNRPINMHIAMQQLLAPDPWLEQKPSEEELKFFSIPDGEDFVAW